MILILVVMSVLIIGYFTYAISDLEKRIIELEDSTISEDDLPDILVDKDLVVDCLSKCLQNHQKNR